MVHAAKDWPSIFVHRSGEHLAIFFVLLAIDREYSGLKKLAWWLPRPSSPSQEHFLLTFSSIGLLIIVIVDFLDAKF